MKNMKKWLSVLLSILLLTTCFSVAASAEEKTEKTESDIACEQLQRDVPLILVTGLGGQYHSGLLTETEEDDVRIWEPTMEIITPVIKEHAFSLVSAILTKNYGKANAILKKAAEGIFGPFSCDNNGIPDPDTGKKENSTDTLRNPNGYANSYDFLFDWRYDVVTLAEQLDAYVKQVMELTGSDKVAFVATSMGNSILMTYLYKTFYTNENYKDSNHIHSAIFIAGTMNGVANCEDPFSANITLNAEALVRYIEGLTGTSVPVLRALYKMGIFEPVLTYVGELVQGLVDNGLYDSVDSTLATIPGFHALMNAERYTQVRELIYNTPDKQEKFATILASGDFFHYEVQPNNVNIIQKMKDSGIRTAVFSQYGYDILPITADNDRMSDGTITVHESSFGAISTATDETLGQDYKQAKECPCGKNHVSPDLQIDASTCAFADTTWFGRDMFHVFDSALLAKLIDLVTYSEEEITVWTYEDLPQYLVREGDSLVPLTQENLPDPPVAIEDSIAQDEEAAKLATTIRLILAAVCIFPVLVIALIVFAVVLRKKKKTANAKAANEEPAMQTTT